MKNQGFVEDTIKIKGGKDGGNAIVIVLIMIALLGALTLTLTRMGSNSNDVSQEQAQVIASQVLRQARTLATATDNLIAKGCSITQLSFDNSLVSGYTNVQSPSDKSCWLFDSAGAGLNFPTPPTNSNDGSNWVIPWVNGITGVGPERETLVSCSSNCQDLMMILPFVNQKICQSLNYSVGVSSSISTAPPQQYTVFNLNFPFSASNSNLQNNNYSNYNTSVGARIQTSAGASTSNPLFDKKSGCFEGANDYIDTNGVTQTGAGKYFFYQVLYER